MADFLAWSHSRLKSFLACPKQLWHSVAPRGHPDRIEFVQTPAMKDGVAVDEALTARIGKRTPLPEKYQHLEGVAEVAVSAPGNKFTQMQLALDQAFKPCGYKDWDNAWVRVAYDFAAMDGSHAHVWDWKNGQIFVDESQLKLYAAVGFATFPELDVIDTSYIWLRHGVTSDRTYRRSEQEELWMEFIPDVNRMQIAHKTNHWPATPDKRACKWCAVNREKKCPVAAVGFGG